MLAKLLIVFLTFIIQFNAVSYNIDDSDIDDNNGNVTMSNYAEEILKHEGEEDVIIQILDIIYEKCNYGYDINQLTEGEKVIYFIGVLEGEVNNGGFSQFLFNTSGKYTTETLDALNDIGAQYTASLLQEAIAIYKNGPTSEGSEGEMTSLTDEQTKKLYVLDEKFYEYKDDLGGLQITYIKNHISDF